MALPEFREVNVTDFRDAMARHLGFVREGGQVYLLRHGQRMAALVPIWHADLMADVEAWSVREMQRRQGEVLAAWEQMRRNAGYDD